jgi:TonB family protein
MAQREANIRTQAAADLVETAATGGRVGTGPPGHWGERARRSPRQTSLIVDPEDGRLPEMTAEARLRPIPIGANEGDPNADIKIDEPVGEAPKEAEVTEDVNTIFTSVEVSPEFPGGMSKFYSYLQKNYRYPAMAREQGVSGKVIMQFVVERDGSLTDIKVLRDLGLGTGEEAVRLLKSMPKWKPGVQNGRAVRVAYTLPIALNLAGQ